MTLDPHQYGTVHTFGAAPEVALGAVILLHGRGGSAEDILSLAREFELPQLAYFAPQAAGHSWYPTSFMASVASNQPWLCSALNKVESIVQMAQDAGIAADRVAVGGFSQGACLATEFVASHPKRYAALFALTGGLVGPPGSDLAHQGSLAGTPAFFGSGDPDPHVPWQRVRDSAQVLESMGAIVNVKRYPGRGHTVSSEELAITRELFRDAFLSK